MQSARKEVTVAVLGDRSRVARPFCVKSVFLPGPPSRIYHFASVCSHTVFSYWWVFSTSLPSFNLFYLTNISRILSLQHVIDVKIILFVEGLQCPCVFYQPCVV